MNEKLSAENFSLMHHAYAIEGSTEIRDGLFKILESSWKIATKGNPDFSYLKLQTLGIDNARNLKEFQERKAFTKNGKKIFAIEACSITAEAQNALLKMFEEPTEDTHFFLIGPCVKNLIPTLASRMAFMSVTPPSQVSDLNDARVFLELPTAKRLALVKKLADDIKDERRSRMEAVALLQKIETLLYDNSKKKSELPQKLFADLEMCRDYMHDPSASLKMLLEYIALVAPGLS